MKDWFKKKWNKPAVAVPPTAPTLLAPGDRSAGGETVEGPRETQHHDGRDFAEAVAPTAAAVHPSESPGAMLFMEAQRLLGMNRAEDAQAVLSRVEAGMVEWGAAQFWRAWIFSSLSRVEEGLVAIGDAIKVDGGKAAYFALQGNLLVRAGRAADAEQPYSRAVELGTDDVWAYIGLGYLLIGWKKLETAVEIIRKGLKVRPEDPSLAAHLGRFLLAAGQMKEAEEVLAGAAQAHATTPLVHVFRSWVMRARGDLAGAAASLRQAIKLDGSKPDWHAQLARLLVEQGHYAEAEQALAQVARLEPSSDAIRELGERIAQAATREAEQSTRPREAVRLVIWDLDDTFWRGTVTEGGIREYVQAHHDAVIELARRGIMSSICSKNDAGQIARILEEREIAPYFIFPSISWEMKGPRIAALIESVQLRPSTVMFIDDNHLNRAEASATVPGLQVEDEHFIGRMLEDVRFKGKDDTELTRLAQYKMLEQRKHDETKASEGGGNEVFLRSCNIRVHIDYDVLGNLDRAIELINRTNQLNFTKQRLPEDPEQARAALAEEVRPYYRQAGLVRVTDRYGDYGFVGFFVTQANAFNAVEGRREVQLLHFCFSCRTLGMLVEKWVYDHLRRPKLRVVGEVLTDLSVERDIDWITHGTGSVDGPAVQDTLAPEIRILGGCESSALGFYLNARSPKVVVRGNFAASDMFFYLNSVDLILSHTDRMGPEFEEEAARLGIPQHLAAFDLFGEAPEGTALVVNCSKDFSFGIRQYRHRTRGWVVVTGPPGRPHLNLVTTDPDQVRRELAEIFRTNPEALERVDAICTHLQLAYVSEFEPFSLQQVETGIRRLIDRVRPGSKLIFVLDHHVVRDKEGRLLDLPSLARANQHVRDIAAEFPFVGTVFSGDSILTEEEIQFGGNHYDRAVYLRVAEALANCIDELRPRRPEAARAVTHAGAVA